MNKLIIILLLALCGVSSSFAYHPQERISPEEFRAKQQTFIAEKANLTKDEAAKFFPLYYELQDKKKERNDKAWKLLKQGKDPKTTEDQYDEIIETVFDLRIETDQMEKTYFKKFRKVLSAQKIYKVQHAEVRFHRELLKNANSRNNQNRSKKHQ